MAEMIRSTMLLAAVTATGTLLFFSSRDISLLDTLLSTAGNALSSFVKGVSS